MDLAALSAVWDPARLLPDSLADFRPLVSEGLLFFIERLPERRRAEIFDRQAALPADAADALRLVTLMRCCPALHKLGQVVARYRALDAELRQHLQELESLRTGLPLDDLMPTIEAELRATRGWKRLDVEPQALAEASVAVVVPLTWTPAGSADVRRGVLKVLKPGIVDRLHEDLEALAAVADFLDERRAAAGLPEFEYRDAFDSVRELLTHEVDLACEQANLAVAAERHAAHRDVCVPALLPFCTPRLTAMERIDGDKVTNVSRETDARRRRLAETIIRVLVGDVVLSREREVMFHADPHAGNLFALPDGRLGILDWSLTGRLTRPQRVQVSQLIAGAVTLDRRRIAGAMEALATALPPADALVETIDAALAEIRRGRMPGALWMMSLLDRVAARGASFPADLLLFRKAVLTIEGVVEDVAPGTSLDPVLLALAIHTLGAEWPMRMFAGFASRGFASGLSNFDLMQIGLSMPLAVANYWSGTLQDWWRGFARAGDDRTRGK